jgi:aspartyl-tRNA(Asn)/glutamyl-tRNA(Gln) amidotransferase subunit B
MPHAGDAAGHQRILRGTGGAHRAGAEGADQPASAFDRKNYFYPDLPQGYQISQLYHPIVGEGEVLVEMGPGVARLVRIERIHLEQDAGKSIHDMDPTMSFVDFNRTGVALMEIVSRPDIRGPEEAAAYVAKLRQILRYLGTCDGNMQNGNLRADVNVSVCRPGQYEKYQATQDFSHLGTRCEIKNMNSMRFIQQAIEYEARRQIAILEDGGRSCRKPASTTPTRARRGRCGPRKRRMITAISPTPTCCRWRSSRPGSTTSPPACRNCPTPRRRGSWATSADRLRRGVLTAELETPPSSRRWRGPRRQAGGELGHQRAVRAAEQGRARHRRQPGFAGAAGRDARPDRRAGEISGKIAKDLFEILWTEGGDPAAIVAAKRGMKQVTDTGAIEAAVDEIIAANPAQVEKAKANPKLAGLVRGSGDEGHGRQGQSGGVHPMHREQVLYAGRPSQYFRVFGAFSGFIQATRT